MDSLVFHAAGGIAQPEARLRFVAPQIPTLAAEPPAGEGWIHEIKQDGYRTQLLLEGGRARALTRNGHDWSDTYAPLCEAAAGLACRAAVLDGEILVQDAAGRSDFAALQRAIARAPGAGRDPGLVFCAFDLLHLDGEDLRPLPLVERRARLKPLVAGAGGPFLYSDDVGDGAALFEAAERLGLEGIVSKRAAGRYRSGPSKGWRKVKCFAECDLVVIGLCREPGGAPVAVLARPDGDALAYAGTAFVGLAGDERRAFWRAVEPLAVHRPALPGLRRKETIWLRPELVARVRHLRGEGHLRHASVKALAAGAVAT